MGEVDPKLLEMAEVFRMSLGNRVRFLYVPSVLPYLFSASSVAIGLAWKSGIAAEVICEPNIGLGTILIEGKGMIDFSSVYAVTLTVVILSLIIEVLLKSLSKRFVDSRRNDA